MTRLPDLSGLTFLIVKIDEHVSTPAAYTELDRVFNDFNDEKGEDGRLDMLVTSLSAGRLDYSCLYNIFEDAVFPIVPVSKSVKEKLLSLGADAAMMSGSGPTVFGIFEERKAAENAREVLAKDGFVSFVAHSV